MILKQKQSKILDWLVHGKCTKTKINISEKYLFTDARVGFFLKDDEIYPAVKKIPDRTTSYRFREEDLIILTESDMVRRRGDTLAFPAFKNNNTSTFIDSKYLKMFSRRAQLKQAADKPLSPILVYEKGDLTGLIMPVKVKTWEGKKC